MPGITNLIVMVVDETGALIPNAHVTVTDIKTGAKRELKTNASGVCTFLYLQRDSMYGIASAVPGFIAQSHVVGATDNAYRAVVAEMVLDPNTPVVAVSSQQEETTMNRADTTTHADGRFKSSIPTNYDDNTQKVRDTIAANEHTNHDGYGAREDGRERTFEAHAPYGTEARWNKARQMYNAWSDLNRGTFECVKIPRWEDISSPQREVWFELATY